MNNDHNKKFGLFKFQSGYKKLYLNSPKGYSRKIINVQTVPDTSVFITICFNDFFPSMFNTRLTSYSVSLLIDVAFRSIEELNVLSYFFYKDFYPCLSVIIVTDGHTVGQKWFTGCRDLTSWIFFMGVSIYL